MAFFLWHKLLNVKKTFEAKIIFRGKTSGRVNSAKKKYFGFAIRTLNSQVVRNNHLTTKKKKVLVFTLYSGYNK